MKGPGGREAVENRNKQTKKHLGFVFSPVREITDQCYFLMRKYDKYIRLIACITSKDKMRK